MTDQPKDIGQLRALCLDNPERVVDLIQELRRELAITRQERDDARYERDQAWTALGAEMGT